MSRDKHTAAGKFDTHTPASAPLKSTGDDAAISIRLLELVYRHDKDPAYLVERARELKRLLLAPES